MEKITAHLQVKDMGLEDNGIGMNDNPGAAPVKFNDRTTITPLVMTPHRHAPSCIRERVLERRHTGEIICNMTALYGDERYGSTNSVFNEANHITIAPCIFGCQPGTAISVYIDSRHEHYSYQIFQQYLATFRPNGPMDRLNDLR